MSLKKPIDFQKQARKMWFPKCKMAVTKWLQASHTKEDVLRLKALGNVVMPQCVEAALHLMGARALAP